ncbi:MAG: ABC transporter substrate-binding protein, partial [Candidatus Methylomirabilales bacterium]
LDDMIRNHNVKLKLLPKDVIDSLRVRTAAVLAEANKDPMSRKVYTSYRRFQDNWSSWAGISEATYHRYIRR